MGLFNQELFTKDVKHKMFSEMSAQNRRIGIREFAKEADVSPSTLSRIENGHMPDLETFFRLCAWMKQTTNKYYHHE